MAVNAVQFGSLYGVSAIKQAQTRPVSKAMPVVCDRELHPQVRSTDVAETPLANNLDFLC